MTNLPPPPASTPPVPPMPPMPGASAQAGSVSEHGPYSFIEAIKVCFSKYVSFKGRARRSEYWYWVLFSWLASTITGGWTIIPSLTRMSADGSAVAPTNTLSSAVSLALFLPGLAVAFRRLHDVNRSGMWLIAPVVCFGIALGTGIAAFVTSFPDIMDSSSISKTAGALWATTVAFGVIGFALYIPILVWLFKDGGPNTPNKYGVRE